jgi:choice-of-anchor A domain-containing protein
VSWRYVAADIITEKFSVVFNANNLREVRSSEDELTMIMRVLTKTIPAVLLLTLGSAAARAGYVLDQLQTAADFSILGLPGATDIHLNGPGTTIGNVGISAGTLSLDSSNPFAILGDLFLASGATVTNPPQVSGTVFTGQDALLTQADSRADAAIAAFSSLATTSAGMGITMINSSETISSAPGSDVLNVLNITGINLGGDQVLTLNGNASDQFVINVSGDIHLDTGKIELSGGLTDADVAINVIGSGTVSTSHGLNDESLISGILLAPDASLAFSPGMIDGEVIAGSNHVQFASGANVVGPPVAEPAPLGLMAVGATALAGTFIIRNRRTFRTFRL